MTDNGAAETPAQALQYLVDVIRRDRREAERTDDGRLAVSAMFREQLVLLHPIGDDDTCRTCCRADGTHEAWPCPTMLALLVVYGWRRHADGNGTEH